ncbi:MULTISPECIES: helix-turn-helix transcriptional regulator [Microbacterium]|uniref:helix-turn-helix transcriptional regulator n=1 Tax=Microbacterium TaxID=33882 RepID=UPI000702080D|nr:MULTISPECIES: transcriptional regulator [Microbacterium]AZS46137.1 Bifunctional ligase/repressor BirA [Microbacterium oxydans]AZS46164.1 Bifunctional ligase/repressor BirA [Microbacterium oxydans]KQV00900.1 DNA-binding transcriptional regulator [Microbacterium sp. Root322]
MRTNPTGRALQLLSLLQTNRFWPCAELAARLGVTERTVRRDLDRLRELGYPVDSTSGRYGGYRLATGAHVPPLILDDEEAVAVAIGLRYAAEAAISGIEETSLRALAKIEALLPHRLRRRVSALHSSVASLGRVVDDDVIHPESLSVFAAACRDHEHVRFDYRRTREEHSRRHVEPHQLVTAGRRWYLVAWDRDRGDWRTFRLDRIQAPRPVGTRFPARTVPGGDAAEFVARSIGRTARDHAATLVIHMPYAEIEGVLRWADHTLREDHAEHCVIGIRSEDLGRLAMTIAEIALTAPVSAIEPAELASAVERLATHLVDRERLT